MSEQNHRTAMKHLATLAPFFLLAIASAQDRSAALARGFDARTACGVVRDDDGAPWAIGDDYKASFRAGTMEFVPALGAAASSNRPLSFRLLSIVRDGAVLHDATVAVPPPPALQPASVSWQRGDILERYEARADGVAQSFVFASRPGGHGDLVVRGAVASHVQPTRAADGALRFVDEIGGVVIGGVTGIDAEGRRCAGDLAWSNGELELRLPGTFVDAAAYPLVLDPLFGTSAVYGGSSYDDGEVDAAYEATGDSYLVVWARAFSATDQDVRALRVDGNGAAIGALLALTTATGIERRPAVGAVRVRQRFFVCWEQGTSVFGPSDVNGRSVDAVSGAAGAVVGIGTGPGDDSRCTVAGDRSMVGDDALVAWISTDSGVVTRPVTIATTGVATPGTINIVQAWGGQAAVRLARSRVPGTVGMLSWSAFASVQVAVLTYTGTVLGTAGALPFSAPAYHSHNLDNVGNGGLIVGFLGGNLYCQSLTWASGALAVGNVVSLSASPTATSPDVAWFGDRYVATWELQTATPFDNEVRGISVLPDCTTVGAEFLVSTVARPSQHSPRMAPRFAGGGGVSTEGLLVWEETDATPPLQGSVVGQRFTTMLGTAPVTLSAGCGGGGTANTNGPFAPGNNDFRFTLTGGDPASPLALLLLGLGDPPIVCGCPITVALASNAIAPVGGTASHPFPVPPNPLFLGFQIEFQWVQFAVAASPCPFVPNMAVSSRVRVSLAP